MSYTTFQYSQPVLAQDKIPAAGKTSVSVTVTNSGSRAGDEVVQMYIHHPFSSVVQPVEILRGFKRVHLEAGASETVRFDLGPNQISILNAEMKRVVEPGTVDILIGSDSVHTTSVGLMVTP